MKEVFFYIIHFTCKIVFPVLFTSLSAITAYGQNAFDSTDFRGVDSFALSVKYENNYIKLAKDLTAPFPEDIYKVRSIFKWITNNIAYDYRFINKGKEVIKPECEDQYDCIEIMRSWENDYIKKVLKTRRGTSEGYSKLFNKLCDLARIQNEVIIGYARTKPYQIGNRMSVNHSWNAVFIDTAWYYLDPTWAAGICIEDDETGKLVKFIKSYKNYYWLTPIDRLTRNHYPKNPQWVEKIKISKEDFFNNPHYYSIEILENIFNESPSTGMLYVKKGDVIHFKLDYKKDIKIIQVNSNIYRNPDLWTTIEISKKKTKVVRDTWAEKKQVYIPFKKTGNTYEFDFKVNDNSLYYLELSFDYKQAMRYKVTVGK